jgi:DHA3 family macrolide efflux protein-like MFS transporter
MAVVAVSWLAIQLAPADQRGTWVAAAAAAYVLPAAAGTFIFGPLFRGRNGAHLAAVDALLRTVALAAIPLAYLVGALTLTSYVALLAVSSLLRSWGSAGRFTLFAEVLPRDQHLAGNATVVILFELGTVAGPPLAGLLIGLTGAPVVFACVAVGYAILAATYRFAVPAAAAVEPRSGSSRGFSVIRSDPLLLSLLALTFVFFFLYGPVSVALPILAADEPGGATVLAWLFTAFGGGAVVGGLLTGYLRRWPPWPTTVAIVAAFGAALLPLGLGGNLTVGIVSLAVAGLIWAPYPSLSTTLLQRSTDTTTLPQVLAANGAVTVISVPLGTLLGGPMVTAYGPRATLLACGLATVAAGLIAAALVLATHRARRAEE